MPNILLPIEDIQDSVERPVIFDIIRQVMDISQISHKVNIQFLGDEGRAAQKNSTITKDAIKENKWSYDEKVTIEVDEDFDRNRMINNYIKNPEQFFIWQDTALNVAIKPVYTSSEVKITVKYRARDKNQANKWRNDMHTRIAMMSDINLHEINYHYHLQEEFIYILKEIHRLRENVAGYGEDWDDYFARRLTANASVITNLNGKAGIWAISERQIRVQGYFDFEGAPEKGDKEGDHDNWAIHYTYSFKYEKPIECNLVYPLIIHQQLLSSKYRPTEKTYRLEDQPRAFSASGKAFSEFESDKYSLQGRGNDGVTIPDFDEFIPNAIIPTTVRVFTALASVTPKDQKNLLNLKELGIMNLDPVIVDFIAKSEYPFMGKAFHSIFTLSLYRDGALTGDNTLTINSNLDVSSLADLSLRQTYRVRLGLVTDISFLRSEALARLRAYPGATAKLISAINAALTDIGGHSDISKNQLSLDDINSISSSAYEHFIRGTKMSLVQTLFVVADKVTNL